MLPKSTLMHWPSKKFWCALHLEVDVPTSRFGEGSLGPCRSPERCGLLLTPGLELCRYLAVQLYQSSVAREFWTSESSVGSQVDDLALGGSCASARIFCWVLSLAAVACLRISEETRNEELAWPVFRSWTDSSSWSWTSGLVQVAVSLRPPLTAPLPRTRTAPAPAGCRAGGSKLLHLSSHVVLQSALWIPSTSRTED